MKILQAVSRKQSAFDFSLFLWILNGVAHAIFYEKPKNIPVGINSEHNND